MTSSNIQYVPHELTYEGQRVEYSITINTKFGGSLIIDEAGFYVWLPPTELHGYIPVWVLQDIANKLNELNAEWQKQVEQDIL